MPDLAMPVQAVGAAVQNLVKVSVFRSFPFEEKVLRYAIGQKGVIYPWLSVLALKKTVPKESKNLVNDKVTQCVYMYLDFVNSFVNK